MRRNLSALLCLAAACARPLPPDAGTTTYMLPDWQAKMASPSAATSSAPTIAASTPSFRAAAPPGYRPADGVFSPPIAAMFIREFPDGEVALIVERYAANESGSMDKNAFISNLGPTPGSAHAVKRKFANKEFEVYEGIEFESLTRRIPPNDPYADRLGSAQAPPRLSFLEERRFPKGGEAYRFYRCRKAGAWAFLRDYRRLKEKGDDLQEFRARQLGPSERGIISACFGQAALLAFETGGEIPDVPKPSMYRLRLMAREEWAYGASRRVEREAVVLVDFSGGFYALRLRAPRALFSSEYPAFSSFAGRFETGL